jgi:hypothetical protein
MLPIAPDVIDMSETEITVSTRASSFDSSGNVRKVS